ANVLRGHMLQPGLQSPARRAARLVEVERDRPWRVQHFGVDVVACQGLNACHAVSLPFCLSAPEALWPQRGDVPGDISSAFQRICLVVFSHGLLASSRGTLEHMDNIGGAGGI